MGKHIGDDETPEDAGDVPINDTITSVSCGGTHTCIIISSGQVKCWGHNRRGQLGNGGVATKLACIDVASDAVAVLGLNAVVKQVSLGMAFGCALLESGDVQCWGDNVHAQLGVSPDVISFSEVAYKAVDIGG